MSRNLPDHAPALRPSCLVLAVLLPSTIPITGDSVNGPKNSGRYLVPCQYGQGGRIPRAVAEDAGKVESHRRRPAFPETRPTCRVSIGGVEDLVRKPRMRDHVGSELS